MEPGTRLDEALAERIVDERAATLSRLIEAGEARADRLAARQRVLAEATQVATELSATLDRRLLWLPTNAALDGAWPERLAAGALWFIAPRAWAETVAGFLAACLDRPLRALVLFAVPGLLFGLRPLMRRRMKLLSDRVGDVRRDRYWVSPAALGVTIMFTLPLPLLVGGLGGILAGAGEPGGFARYLAAGVAALASVLYVLTFFRMVCRDDGLLARHFHWSDVARRRLRRTLVWFAAVEGGAALVLATVLADGDPILRYGLGVAAFMVGSIGLGAFGFAFFRPATGIAVAVAAGTKTGRLARLMLPVAVAAPLIIGVMPVFGYFDTAIELQQRLFQSALLLLLTALLYGLLMRTFIIANRRYARRHAAEEARRAAEAAAAAPREEDTGQALPAKLEEKTADPAELARQGVKFIRAVAGLFLAAGLWLAWRSLLPALGIADEVVLWEGVRIIDGVAASAPVTLWDLILGIGLIVGFAVAARHARSLLEVSLFQRIGLDAGARYAAVTMLGYVLVFVGVLTGFAQLGVDWSRLQWIVAALGVGLGFGLQEIVANFISGIIILFERPVRVGDTVTIGSLSGTVTNIKIRATTITDFENREVLLPNKAIITENVTNWTRNDTVTRILLPIGVAYGTDPDRVQQLLLGVVASHPDVLEAPAPSVFFALHGESSLDFEVRAFVDATAKRLPVAHDLNTRMNRALGDAGIEIPFPQRDLRVVHGSIAAAT